MCVAGRWPVKGVPSYARDHTRGQIILNVVGSSVLLHAPASMPAAGALYRVVWFGQEKEFGADPVAAYGWPRD